MPSTSITSLPDRTRDQSPRRATNVTLPETMLREARDLGINLSQACERGLAQEIREQRGAAWLRDNRAAIEAMNEYIEKHGIPLEEFRQF